MTQLDMLLERRYVPSLECIAVSSMRPVACMRAAAPARLTFECQSVRVRSPATATMVQREGIARSLIPKLRGGGDAGLGGWANRA